MSSSQGSREKQHRLESIPLENVSAPSQPVSYADKALIRICDGLSSIIGMIIIIGLGLHMIVTGWLFRNDCGSGVLLPFGVIACGVALLVLSTYFPLYRCAFQKAKAIATRGSAPLTLELVHKNFPCYLNKLYNCVWLLVFADHSFFGFQMYKRFTTDANLPCAPVLYWTAYVLFLIYVFFIVYLFLYCVILCVGSCYCRNKITKWFG